MNAFMEAVLTVAREEPSALTRARLQRQLTPEEAARRAGLTQDEVEWLEEGRFDDEGYLSIVGRARDRGPAPLHHVTRHRPP